MSFIDVGHLVRSMSALERSLDTDQRMSDSHSIVRSSYSIAVSLCGARGSVSCKRPS